MVKSILNDGIKCFVLSMQGVNHIGIAHGGYKTYGKLLDHLLKIIEVDLLNKSI